MPNTRLCLCLAFIMTLSISNAQAGEVGFHPSIAVSEEYNDNVLETSNNRIGDYITHALPGLALTYNAQSINADLLYQLDYRHYARNSVGDETVHTLRANGHFVSPGNMLYLDVSNDYSRVSLDYARDVSSESLFKNQSDRNKAIVSPYIVLQVTPKTKFKVGYRYVDTRYFDQYGTDKIDHTGFMDVSVHLTEKLSLISGYSFTRGISDIYDYDQHQAFGGCRYDYAEKSYVFGQGGYTWTSFNNRDEFNTRFWNGGFVHTFDNVIATIITGVKYDEDPLRNIIENSFVEASAENISKFGSVRLSANYSEYTLIETDTLQTKKYGVTIRGSHEFTSDLSGRVAFTAEKFEYPSINSYTRRFLVDSGVSYLLANQLTLSFTYIYSVYNSPDIVADNRHVNRAIIEIKKTF